MSLLALLDPFADHTDFPTLPYTPGGGLPYETDGDARQKFWI